MGPGTFNFPALDASTNRCRAAALVICLNQGQVQDLAYVPSLPFVTSTAFAMSDIAIKRCHDPSWSLASLANIYQKRLLEGERTFSRRRCSSHIGVPRVGSEACCLTISASACNSNRGWANAHPRDLMAWHALLVDSGLHVEGRELGVRR